MDVKNIIFNGIKVENLIETDNVVSGDLILFTEDVYEGEFFNAKVIGRRNVLAKVYRHNYGHNYITFSLKVIDAIGCKADEVKEKLYIRKREPNLLSKYKVYRTLWKNEINRCYLLDGQYVFKNYLKEKIS